ncbi:acylphosphatase domain-containing protein [Sarocladium implicatum]|nr:acylphosphatase domain-containing protein [Sarocladium implicatum]
MASQRVSFVAHGGQVQGVGFRYFAQKKANEYGVTGWCRNTPDNKVEGEAQGPDEAVSKFLKAVDQGPSQAKVVQLSTEGRDVVEGESKFDIRH